MSASNTPRLRSQRHWRNQCTQRKSHSWTLASHSNEKRLQLFSVTFRPGCVGGGRVVGAKVDSFTQMNEAQSAMKALNKQGFWQTKWKNFGGEKEGQSSSTAAECERGPHWKGFLVLRFTLTKPFQAHSWTHLKFGDVQVGTLRLPTTPLQTFSLLQYFFY